jgi:hypothetical protein
LGLLPLETAPAQEPDRVKEQIFQEVEKAFQMARYEGVPLLAPKNLAKAREYYHKAISDYDRGERLRKIQENLKRAKAHLDAAFEATRLSRSVLEPLIQIREQTLSIIVRECREDESRSRYFKGRLLTDDDFREKQSYHIPKAEQKFRKVVMKIEDGDETGAISIAGAAEKQYRKSAIEALEKGLLADAKKRLKDVETAVPRESLRRAKTELEETESVINSQKGAEFAVGELVDEVRFRIQQALSYVGIEVPAPHQFVEKPAPRPPEMRRQPYFGKYRGVVTDNQDPNNLGRITARVPRVLGDVNTGWALPCTPYAGTGSGIYTVPEPGAGVWIEFEEGDVSRPIWSGSWWGENQLPRDENGTEATPPLKIIRTEKGLMVTLDDKGQTIILSDSNGGNILTINVQKGQVEIKGTTKVILEAPLIELAENATHPVVLGDQLLQYLNQLVSLYNGHMHPGQMAGSFPVTPAPPVPPSPPPTPNLLSKRVKSE